MSKKIDLESKKDYLISSYQNGNTFATLGKEIGCNECTIRTFLKKYIQIRQNPKAPKNWDLRNQEVIDKYNAGVSMYQMSVDLNIPLSTLARMHKNLGLDVSYRSKVREDLMKNHEQEVIDRYLAGESEQLIANSFTCNISTISRILTKNNIETRFHYTVDHTFFDKIDTEVKAYILGYFTADGCNYSQNNIISITSIDLDIIERFKKEWKYTGPIYTEQPNKNFPDRKVKYVISVSSKSMSDRLKVLGCDNRKTFTTKFPLLDLLPEKLHRHYIRGLCDGDGSLFVEKDTTNRKISIAGTEKLLSPIMNLLNKKLGTTGGLYPQGNIFVLKYGGQNQVLKVVDFLYKDSTIYLERKYKIYQSWLKQG